MKEKETRRTPNFFERLGSGRFFGHGRRLGIQMGSLEQRLTDPFNKVTVTDTVLRYWYKPSIPKETLVQGARILAEQVNAGKADKDLIPKLEHALSLHPGSVIDDETTFDALCKDPSSISYLYETIIASADTVESIPYLLQALDSSFCIREHEPYRSSGPELVEQHRVESNSRREVDPHSGGIPIEYTVYEETVYDIYSQEMIYRITHIPFSELTRKQLEDIITHLDDAAMTDKIRKAIINSDEHKRTEVTVPMSFTKTHTEYHGGPPRMTSYYGS